MNTPKPRVVIDARMVGPLGHGIANYVLQLASGLSRLDLPYEPCYLLHRSCPPDSLLRSLPHAESELPFLHPRELWSLGDEIAQLEPALYHTPSFASLLRYPCDHVQTVHDLNHLHFGGLKEKAYYRFVLLPSLRRAACVASVSRSAAQELEAWMRGHGLRKTVLVAPNSILPFPSVADESALLHRYGLEAGRYFFALANAKPHKNLALLERAYLAARARQADLPPLVLSIAGESADGILRVGPLGDLEIGPLLANARAFFFPSLYEGFGRPPLEAALTGTVPWASDIPVHREVLSGVPEAHFLPPASESAWSEAFLACAAAGEVPRVSASSRKWIAETYSEARVAGIMDGIYQRALGIE